MDLTHSDEARMLAEALASFVSRERAADVVRDLEVSDDGYSRSQWDTLCEIGVPGLLVAEQFGGSGRTMVEMSVACRELGRGAIPGPIGSSAVLATTLLMCAGSDEHRAQWLPELVAGTQTATVAMLEPGARHEWEPRSTRFVRHGDAVRISGTKILVPYASSADAVIVVGVLDGAPAGAIVDMGSSGLGLRRQHDGGGDAVFELQFVDVEVGHDALLRTEDFAGVLDRSLDAAVIAAVAYAAGGAHRALELVIDHASNRIQFGRPIGAFQAVSHRCVDIHCDVEAVEYLCWQAAATYETPRRRSTVSAAKAFASDAIRRIYTNAHQVMGAIGYSMEHELQLHSRRGKVFELSLGGAAFHYHRVADEMNLQ